MIPMNNNSARGRLAAIFLAFQLLCAGVSFAGSLAVPASGEDKAFREIAELADSSGTLREYLSIRLNDFATNYPSSAKLAYVRFLQGELYFDQALALLRGVKTDSVLPKDSPAAEKFARAEGAYAEAARLDASRQLESSAEYRQAEIAYDKGLWEQADRKFGDIVSSWPRGYLEPYSMLGMIYSKLALQDTPAASEIYDKLLSKHPAYENDPDSLLAGGFLALEKGDYDTAEKRFSRLSSPEGYYYRACLLMFHSKPFLAAAALEKLHSEYPETNMGEKAEFLIGDVFFKSKDYDGAQSQFRRFIARYPQSQLKVAALFHIAICHFKRGETAEAVKGFSDITAQYPADFYAPFARYFTGNALFDAGKLADAAKAYAFVAEKYPGNKVISPAASLKLSWCLYKQGDYEGAARTAEKFTAEHPDDKYAKYAYVLLGKSRAAQNRHQDAYVAFHRIIDLYPASQSADQALLYILKTEFEAGNYTTVAGEYKKLVQDAAAPDSLPLGMVYLYSAEAYYALGLYDEAYAIYSGAAKNFTDRQVILQAKNGLAWCLLAKGDPIGAKKELEIIQKYAAITGISLSTAALINYGDIADGYFNDKKYEDAYQLYTNFLRDSPGHPRAAVAAYHSGLSLYYLKYYAQAIDVWKDMSAKYGGTAESESAEYLVADTYFRAQKYPEAIAAYSRLLRKYPQSKSAELSRFRIAQSAYNGKNYQLALKQLEETIESSPDSQTAMDSLEILESVFDLSPSADYAAVLAGIVAAHPASKSAAEAQFRLARRLFEKKEYSAAIKAVKKFSADYAASPNLANAQLYLAETYFQKKNYPEAALVFARIVQNFNDPQTLPLALFRLGSLKYSLNKYGEAIAAYNKLLDGFPASEYANPAMFNLGLAYRADNKPDMAEKYYRKYLETAGADSDNAKLSWWEIFNIRKDSGDSKGALEALRGIMTKFTDTETALEGYYRMGELYASKGQKADAREAFSRLEGMKPRTDPFRLQGLIKLAQMLEDEKQYKRAAQLYEDIAANTKDEKVAEAAKERAQQLSPDKSGN